VKPKSIKVEFIDDEIGAIVARTCSNLFTFPRGACFEGEEEFAEVMNSVIEFNLKGLTFNTV
jgi:hypothetical protein